MQKHFKTLSSLFILTFVLVLPFLVFAQTSTPQKEGMLNNLNSVATEGGYVIGENANLPTVVGTIIQAVLALLGIIFIILMIYAGFTWMTASGNETKIDKAKNMIQTAIIGLIITLSSWAIWTYLLSSFIV